MLLLLALLGATLPAAAQGNVLAKIGQWSKTTITIPEIRTASQVLAQRAEQSIRQAQQAYQSLPENFPLNVTYAPAVQLVGASAFYNTSLYPNVYFLTSNQRAKNYIIARNNRLLVNEIHRLNDFAPVMEMHYPAIKRRAVLLEKLPQYQGLTQIQWIQELVRLIPAQTRYLFIGEQHNLPAIQQALQDFLVQLRKTYPQRKIILFSEFLPKGISFDSVESIQSSTFNFNKYETTSYLTLFENALANDIPIVGLEHPDYDFFNPDVQMINGHEPNQIPFWNSLEGLHQRNDLWYQILQTHRNANPDALFVIHTGAGHALYNRPFSLGARFSPKETFVAAFYPQPSANIYYRDPVELLYKPAHLPETFLHLTIPAHIQAAGFNARLRVPVSQ